MNKEQEEEIIHNIYYCGLGIILCIFISAHLILQQNKDILLLLILLTAGYFIYFSGIIHRIINMREPLRKRK